MKNLIRKLTIKILAVNWVWYLMKPFVKLADFLKFQRSVSQQYRVIHNADTDRVISALKGPVVHYGPFRNLVYPDYISYGSSLFPKIIGTYERELAAVMETIEKNEYSEIIDIGCAEGYYAVGLARIKPDAIIYAYDIDPNAREACKKMAAINNVSGRVHVNGICTADTLASFKFSGRGLIICDCEGYERELFNDMNVSNLANCDILIETHDFIYPGISTYLEQVFGHTHGFGIITSVDDVQKLKLYDLPEAKDLSFIQRRMMFGEGRPAIMEWYWFRPKEEHVKNQSV